MNRSYSKIRHMQQANVLLENRKLEEKSKHLLMEGEQTAVLSLNIPTTNGQIDNSKNIPFSIGPLGKNAAKRLKEVGLPCLELPHPSGRNRKWNEANVEQKIADELKKVLETT